MVATKYTYSELNDTFTGVLNSDSLESEYEASSIVTAFDHIDTAGDVVDIWTKGALSTADQTTLGTVVGAHTGVAQAASDQNEHGIQRIAMSPGKPGLKMVVVGNKFTAAIADPGPATTNDDKSFGEDRELQGAWCEVFGHTPGDYVELFAVHPVGGVVGQFGETIYIPPSGKIDQVISEGVEVIPAGIMLRMSYTAVAIVGTPPEVYGYYRMRK